MSWFVYEGLCRSPLGRNDVRCSASCCSSISCSRPIAFTHLFNGRAAFLHTGAMIATWMSASVFFVIIPNQKKVVAALLAGRTPDPALGKQAKQRSTHNNYLTLPVIFLMLSNHYPLAWSSRYAVGIIGLDRDRRRGRSGTSSTRSMPARARPGGPGPSPAICIAVAIWLSIIGKPGYANLADAQTGATAATVAASFDDGGAGDPVPLLHVPCGGAGLGRHRRLRRKACASTRPEEIARHAEIIRIQSVLTHAMPPNNITEMTLDERKAVATWLAARRTAILR